MGAIVSAPRHRRPASASAPCQRPLVREDRPASAPPSLILSADRAVDVARRREALQRVDEAKEREHATQDEGNAARFTRAISPQQAMQLDRMVGEALVDQVLHEGQGACALPGGVYGLAVCTLCAYRVGLPLPPCCTVGYMIRVSFKCRMQMS